MTDQNMFVILVLKLLTRNFPDKKKYTVMASTLNFIGIPAPRHYPYNAYKTESSFN